ncbi:MAG: hypothetical protein AVDCRST_MAG48-3525, partial [uncultured Friedmanniella sp.]
GSQAHRRRRGGRAGPRRRGDRPGQRGLRDRGEPRSARLRPLGRRRGAHRASRHLRRAARHCPAVRSARPPRPAATGAADRR